MKTINSSDKTLEEIHKKGINLEEDKEIICIGGKFVIKSGTLLKILNSDPNKVLCWDGKVWNNIGK